MRTIIKILFFLISVSAFSGITITSPTEEVLSSMYISSSSVGTDCNQGLTVVWNTSVSNLNNQILVKSTIKDSGNASVCYKYNNVFYGTGCNSCVSSATTTFPYYSSGNVTLFIPYIEMADSGDLSSASTFTLSLGVDCAQSDCSSKDNDIEDNFDEKTTITINIDNVAPTGYVNTFTLDRGDSSIYVTAFDLGSLSDSGSAIDQVCLYYNLCSEGTDLSSSYRCIDANSSLPWVIDGLENGTSYAVRATVKDRAGNYYGDDIFVNDSDGDINAPACVTPTEILGFLNGEEKCFVATEMYGKGSSEVVFFRYIRDKFLMESLAGRMFVRTYYFVSPYFIPVLQKKPFVRLFVGLYLETIYNISGLVLL